MKKKKNIVTADIKTLWTLIQLSNDDYIPVRAVHFTVHFTAFIQDSNRSSDKRPVLPPIRTPTEYSRSTLPIRSESLFQRSRNTLLGILLGHSREHLLQYSPNAVLPVGRVVLGQLFQEGYLLLSGLAHGVVVADHFQGHLRRSSNGRWARSSHLQHTQTDKPTNKNKTNSVKIEKKYPRNHPQEKTEENTKFPGKIRKASQRPIQRAFRRIFRGTVRTTARRTTRIEGGKQKLYPKPKRQDAAGSQAPDSEGQSSEGQRRESYNRKHDTACLLYTSPSPRD